MENFYLYGLEMASKVNPKVLWLTVHVKIFRLNATSIKRNIF